MPKQTSTYYNLNDALSIVRVVVLRVFALFRSLVGQARLSQLCCFLVTVLQCAPHSSPIGQRMPAVDVSQCETLRARLFVRGLLLGSGCYNTECMLCSISVTIRVTELYRKEISSV